MTKIVLVSSNDLVWRTTYESDGSLYTKTLLEDARITIYAHDYHLRLAELSSTCAKKNVVSSGIDDNHRI